MGQITCFHLYFHHFCQFCLYENTRNSAEICMFYEIFPIKAYVKTRYIGNTYANNADFAFLWVKSHVFTYIFIIFVNFVYMKIQEIRPKYACFMKYFL